MSSSLPLTKLVLHTDFQVGTVDPRIFGGFMEHMGRCVYQGVYDPECAHADENGFRKDVLGALKRLKFTAMRYPGGNFASGYHWLDGVGPKDDRPRSKELAWKSIEPNQFGTDEYIRMCRIMDWTPMITVNLGTGLPEEASDWVEYCNSATGTYYADLREENGNEEPYGVKLWCLGNEMDGPWQIGHRPAAEYGSSAAQAAKMMKDTDKTIEVVVSGSSYDGMPTFAKWDMEALERVGRTADYLSMHMYVGNVDKDTANFLAVSNRIDAYIEKMNAVCVATQARLKSDKRAFLCFDEWNVWYKAQSDDGEWKVAPHLVEEVYNLEDALVCAGFLNSFIRHADMVKIANIAQVVNVIAPILTDGDKMLLQSIFYAIEMYANRRDGVSLKPVVKGPTYVAAKNGEVTFLDSSAVLSADGKKLHVFAVNRSLDSTMPLIVDISDKEVVSIESADILTGPAADAANSYDDPNVVITKPFSGAKVAGGKVELSLQPLSFVAMTLVLNAN